MRFKSGFWIGNLMMVVSDYLLEIESNVSGRFL
jgi:hypothetical protein